LSELKSPYPLRKGQSDLVELIDETLSREAMCLVHAPTGIGKTLAALLGSLPHLGERRKILYVVNRKNQIPIVLKELKRINEENGTSYKATAFASKADLCRDEEINKLAYRELLEACELRRMNSACPYFNSLFEGSSRYRSLSVESLGESSTGRRKSAVAEELETRILKDMPPPHLVGKLAREVERDLGGDPVCVYEVLKWTAKHSDVLIGTFWYSFHPVVAPAFLRTLSIDRKDLILICDEAHNLPKFCREALSQGMSSTRIQYALDEVRGYQSVIEQMGISSEGLSSFLKSFSRIYDQFQFTSDGKHLPLGLAKIALKRRGVSSFEGPIESLEAAGSAVLEAKILRGQPPKSHITTVASFVRPFLLEEDPSFERFCVRGLTKRGRTLKRLEIRCLDPAPLSSAILDPSRETGAAGSVLMSGTLVPADYYRNILGISTALHKEFPNVFPRENRALFLDDSISLAWKSRSEAMYDRILERMYAIDSNTPGGAMFFFPSYEVMERIRRKYDRGEVLVEERASTKRDDAERALKEGRNILAVMGASLGEGLDLPGLIKAVSVFGLPLEKISDLIRLGMSYYEARFPGRGRDYFYYLPAVTRIVQAAGRAHRRKQDKAALYIFDRRFCRYYLKSAPEWWRTEGVKLKDTADLVARTREFWKETQSA